MCSLAIRDAAAGYQNLANGSFQNAPFVDDTYGGPAPDDAHLSGVVLRLNAYGSAPADNPFHAAGAALGGEVGANIQKLFSCGHRNGFGMAFDPYRSDLWVTENGDDAFSELNRVEPGSNGGWIQIMGPQHGFFDYKDIDVSEFGRPCSRCDCRPLVSPTIRAKLFMLPEAKYDPALSWKYESGHAGTAFLRGRAFGAANEGTLWFGSSRAFEQVGETGGPFIQCGCRRTATKGQCLGLGARRLCRRQPDQVGPHRNRDPHYRHRVRYYAGHPAGRRREPLRPLDY